MQNKSGIEQVWSLRLDEVADALRENNFKVNVLDSLKSAAEFFTNTIMPELAPKSVGVAGSETVKSSGLYQVLTDWPGLVFYNPYDQSLPPELSVQVRKDIFTSDLLITSSNAITRAGELVNLDGSGNRVAAMIYGPVNVVLFVGRNKICEDMDSAFRRIKEFSAPANSIRLSRKNACVKTGYCMDCKSPERICAAWSIIEKCAPKERIHILLINEDVGF